MAHPCLNMEITFDTSNKRLTDFCLLLNFLRDRLSVNGLHSKILDPPYPHENSSQEILLSIPHPDETKYLFLAQENDFKILDSKTGLLKLVTTLEDVSQICLADKNFLLRKFIENICFRGTHSDEIEKIFIPGILQKPKTKPLYEGRSILNKLENLEIIKDIYHPHDYEYLKILRDETYRLSVRQIKNDNRGNIFSKIFNADQIAEKLRNYYSSQIGLYFEFINYFNVWLSYLILIYLPILLWKNFFTENVLTDHHIIMPIICTLWSILFTEFWERKCKRVSFKYGTIDLKNSKTKNCQKSQQDLTFSSYKRRQFHGKIVIDSLTGKKKLDFDSHKRYARYLVTWFIVFLNCCLAVTIMLVYYDYEKYYMDFYGPDNSWEAFFYVTYPGIVYSIFIAIYSQIYRILATKLTEFENHETDKNFENQIILKYCIFEFINNFIALYYIAFVYQDFLMLKLSVRNFFIINMIIGQILESGLPYFLTRRKTKKQEKLLKEQGVKDPKISIYDCHRDQFTSTFDEYLELWLQFGHIILFSSIFPHAAFLSLFNNLIEFKTDCYRILNICKRSAMDPADSIGSWKLAFRILSYFAIISNIALLLQNEIIYNYLFELCFENDIYVILLAGLLEHFVFGVRWCIMHVINEIPRDILLKIEEMEWLEIQKRKSKVE